MARQVGIIRLRGTIGNINFYRPDLARKAGGGYTAEAIRTKPSMRRTRENASEFGHASSTKSLLRRSLKPFLCIVKDGRLHGRMQQQMVKIVQCDTRSPRGQRRVALALQTIQGQQLFSKFVFSPTCSYLEPLASRVSYDLEKSQLHWSPIPSDGVVFPPEVSQTAVTFGILHIDFDQLHYNLTTLPPYYFSPKTPHPTAIIDCSMGNEKGLKIIVMAIKSYCHSDGRYVLLRKLETTGVKIIAVHYK